MEDGRHACGVVWWVSEPMCGEHRCAPETRRTLVQALLLRVLHDQELAHNLIHVMHAPSMLRQGRIKLAVGTATLGHAHSKLISLPTSPPHTAQPNS